ncbi:MAG: GNAT family N-acetyltransferase [Candidatus Dormibacteria bacterium]
MQSERVAWRTLTREDFAHVAKWLADPAVRRWWGGGYGLDRLEAEFGPRIDGDDPTAMFVVEVDGVASGLIQRYRTRDYPEWQETIGLAVPRLARAPTAGMDYLLGRPQVRRRGVGSALVASFSRSLLRDWSDVVAIVVAVQQANRRSWRALERVGYGRIWAGTLLSQDPSDQGPSYLYSRSRERDEPGYSTVPVPDSPPGASQPLEHARRRGPPAG